MIRDKAETGTRLGLASIGDQAGTGTGDEAGTLTEDKSGAGAVFGTEAGWLHVDHFSPMELPAIVLLSGRLSQTSGTSHGNPHSLGPSISSWSIQHLRTDGETDRRTDGKRDKQTDGQTDRRRNGRTD